MKMSDKSQSVALALALAFAVLFAVTAASAADGVAPRKAFFKQHCIKCHGPDKQKGKVRLDDLPPAITDVASAARWEDVLIVLEEREMPPEDEPAVPEAEYKRMVGDLKAMIDAGLSEHDTFPATPIRRMNRFQYNNAVIDLLDLKVVVFALPERMMREYGDYFDPASGKMPAKVQVGSRPLGKSQLIEPRLQGVAPFPQDLRAEHGFDNRADHLSLSPLLMESFLKLSKSIVTSRDFGPRTVGVWDKLFAAPKGDVAVEDAVRNRLRVLLTRAFRRTASDELVDRYAQPVLARIEDGGSFESGMKLAVAAALASPRFLYLYDRGETEGESGDDFDLASRLSFFLWGSIPDPKLLKLAEAGTLSEPAVLSGQIDRMLNDKKMKRFCDAFPAQWLQLEQIISSKPRGEGSKPFYFSRYRVSMQMMMEPLLLFETVLIEDRSILELIDPPFSYRSALLQTWFTRGRGKTGGPVRLNFQRVPNEDRREGGVITNPAIMTMTSTPDRSAPIKRGAWMATVIFNSPPEPPPADVPPLPEGEDADTEHLTLRERLDAHRKRADCKGCHAKIDPLGFALENYNRMGVWRDKYPNGRDVDPSGKLFRKHAFSNPVEFKDAILAEKDRFAKAFAKHVLSYALARETEVTDGPAIDTIVQRVAADGYRMRTLLKHVAMSEPFVRKKRATEVADGTR